MARCAPLEGFVRAIRQPLLSGKQLEVIDHLAHPFNGCEVLLRLDQGDSFGCMPQAILGEPCGWLCAD